MKRLHRLLATVLIASSVHTVAFADPEQHGGRMPPGLMKEELDKLDLTDSQKDALKALRKSKRDNWDDDKALFEQRKAFMDKMFSANASEAELRGLRADLNKKTEEMEQRRFENMLALRAILTPAQRETFHKNMEERMQNDDGPFKKWRDHKGFNDDK